MLLLLLLSRFSCAQLCATPERAAHQAPPSLGFSRQEHWSGLPFPSPMHESEKWEWSHSVMSDSLRPHGLQPTRLLCPWDFPGKSTGVGCHHLLSLTPYTKINSKSIEICSFSISRRYPASKSHVMTMVLPTFQKSWYRVKIQLRQACRTKRERNHSPLWWRAVSGRLEVAQETGPCIVLSPSQCPVVGCGCLQAHIVAKDPWGQDLEMPMWSDNGQFQERKVDKSQLLDTSP